MSPSKAQKAVTGCLSCGGLGCGLCDKGKADDSVDGLLSNLQEEAAPAQPSSMTRSTVASRGARASTMTRSTVVSRGVQGVATRHESVVIQGALGEVLKDGMMEKYGTSMLAGWQKRHFQLHSTGLAYFTDKQTHMKIIRIESITDIQFVDGELRLTWEDRGKSAVHKLRAETADETEAWEMAIKDAWGYSATE